MPAGTRHVALNSWYAKERSRDDDLSETRSPRLTLYVWPVSGYMSPLLYTA